jgi:hypothetical protein
MRDLLAEDRRDLARSAIKDRTLRVKGRASAAYVASNVLGLAIMGTDGNREQTSTVCGSRDCRAGERGKPAGFTCANKGAGFSCLCGHYTGGDTITMVQACLGLGFAGALDELERALPGRAVRTDRAGSGDLFGAPAPIEREGEQ